MFLYPSSLLRLSIHRNNNKSNLSTCLSVKKKENKNKKKKTRKKEKKRKSAATLSLKGFNVTFYYLKIECLISLVEVYR
jgi:hypothetical protein